MKGILLVGGTGSRFTPLTIAVNKHLLPIYDKPVIFYSLSILLEIGIREILVISDSNTSTLIRNLLGHGDALGLSLEYAIQDNPRGIAEAFILGEKFIGDEEVCLVLGDNFLYGSGLSAVRNLGKIQGAVICGYQVECPSDFGVLEVDKSGNILSIEEKPVEPKSNYAIPGIYFYDNKVIEYAKRIRPTARGELEISEINNIYLKEGCLQAHIFDSQIIWYDVGMPGSLLQASEFVHEFQRTNGQYIGCIEEIVWKKGYISSEQLKDLGARYLNSDYGQYILQLVK